MEDVHALWRYIILKLFDTQVRKFDEAVKRKDMAT